MASSIGGFQFVRLDRPPNSFARLIEVEGSAGVDGQAFWDMGIRGRPFVSRSFVDAPSAVSAEKLFHQYEKFQREYVDPVVVTWANYIVPRMRCHVLAVNFVVIQPGVMGIGGLGGGPATLVASWQLNPVSVAPED